MSAQDGSRTQRVFSSDMPQLAVDDVPHPRTPVPVALARSLRPRHWTKNLLVFGALVFAQRVLDPAALLRTSAAFAVFCAVSSAVYLGNDVHDAAADRHHDRKKLRPVASGELSPVAASAAATVLALAGVAAAAVVSVPLAVVAAGYLALQLAYTLRLKHAAVLDVMAIAAGFVLRAVAGAAAIMVEVSPWLLLCTFLLALFLGFAKRRNELEILDEDAPLHRASLAHYSMPFIDAMISTTAGATLVVYALYTFFSPVAKGRPYLMLTVPYVAYGLFRYLYLLHVDGGGGQPEEILLTDRPLITDLVLWLVTAGVILYLS